MSRNNLDSANQQSRLIRENSLPTYEEATGKVELSAPALAPVHNSAAIVNNVNEHAAVIDDDLMPTYHPPRPRTEYSSSPRHVPRPRTDLDVETGIQRGLQHQTQHTDPVVRQMAQTVLAECERARRKRESQKTAQCIGIVIGIILAVIIFAVKLSKTR